MTSSISSEGRWNYTRKLYWKQKVDKKEKKGTKVYGWTNGQSELYNRYSVIMKSEKKNDIPIQKITKP